MRNTNFIKPSECDLGDNWENYFLEISSIRKGETFYECYPGRNIKLKALKDAERTSSGWVCYAENSKGEKIELFMSANTSYTGVSFFRTPQHLEYDDSRGYIYPIV